MCLPQYLTQTTNLTAVRSSNQQNTNDYCSYIPYYCIEGWEYWYYSSNLSSCDPPTRPYQWSDNTECMAGTRDEIVSAAAAAVRAE